MLTDTAERTTTDTGTTHVLHLEAVDIGGRRARGLLPTCCRRLATRRELADHRDLVTCPACKAALDLFDQQEF